MKREPQEPEGCMVEPRAKLFLSSPKVEGLFGSGKWRLLREIDREGSIQTAANNLGRSYRKAWGDIKRAEEGLGRALVIRTRGGACGGGKTVLTPFGKQLVEAWANYRESVMDQIERLYAQHIDSLLSETKA